MLIGRWRRLAERILHDYAQERQIIMIVLMNGGYKFFEDLKKQIDELVKHSQVEQIDQVVQIQP